MRGLLNEGNGVADEIDRCVDAYRRLGWKSIEMARRNMPILDFLVFRCLTREHRAKVFLNGRKMILDLLCGAGRLWQRRIYG
jgi:hypothetical protein